MQRTLEDITLRAEASLLDALTIFDKGVLNSVIIVDDNMKLMGLASDGDIRRALIQGKEPSSPIEDAMNKQPTFAYVNEIETKKFENIPPNSIIPVVDKDSKLVDFITNGLNDFLENYVVLMAGGFGKRLGSLTSSRPKPMLEIQGKPLLQFIIEKFKSNGFKNFIITTHFLSETIMEYFGDGSSQNIKISYVHEEFPLGTAGSLGLLENFDINEPFFVANGDVFCDINYRHALDRHIRKKNDLTILTADYDYTLPFGHVVKTENEMIQRIDEKPTFSFEVLSGNYIFDSNILNEIQANKRLDMDELISILIMRGANLGAFNSCTYWLDIGTPERYSIAEQAF